MKENLAGDFNQSDQSVSEKTENIRGPFQKAGLVKTEFINPEMRKNLSFPFHKEREGTLACFRERGNLSSRSVTVVTDYEPNLVGTRFFSVNLEFLSVSALFQPNSPFDFLIRSVSR